MASKRSQKRRNRATGRTRAARTPHQPAKAPQPPLEPRGAPEPVPGPHQPANASQPPPEPVRRMFYTRDDLAVMLAVSPATIGRMDADNQIPGRRRFRGQVRYHVPAVDAWVAGGEGDGS